MIALPYTAVMTIYLIACLIATWEAKHVKTAGYRFTAVVLWVSFLWFAWELWPV